jgi:hypothetical protein
VSPGIASSDRPFQLKITFGPLSDLPIRMSRRRLSVAIQVEGRCHA